MAHPKRRVSKQRKNKRRTHYKAEIPTLTACTNCGETVLCHRVCPKCGYYKGRLILGQKAEA